ncbi:MAG: valine--tRNA ligase [Verrucomicrobia bacterium]|nr:valine--tRNA ligase [Verrucomicrobiota bacterium]
MSELEKHYDPKEVDSKWYAFWEESGFFTPKGEGTHFTIVMPPPNVTGSLHMGHALVNTLQDLLIRWKRMCGFDTLWIPGTDHAGIATQTVVERHLMKQEGKRRKDYSREEFIRLVWEWKKDKEERITSQLRLLGCSCDWSRYRFTLDKEMSRAVRVMFKKMYDEGLIYQSHYLVNWDPVTQTALADDEVEYIERQTYLWYLHYGPFVVATTRPETLFGDTAVAVHPSDERYAQWIGKEIAHPLTGRLIPVIADPHVDPQFGTGVVKITPAHDPNDYEMALCHQLPLCNIMTPDGRLNEEAAEFAGMTMEEGRGAVAKKLETLGLLLKREPHTHRVGLSYRSKAVIEPYLSEQWFVKTSEFSKQLHTAVSEGRVEMIPKSWEHTYFHWIDHLRDWCISRQLWWGHQIPVWYHKEDRSRKICYDGEGLPPQVAAEPDHWFQDPDALDTWFSSALWPFSTLGWPDQTADLAHFYPTSVLVTGHDILFFWVARMILMGEYALRNVPFTQTFIHGLIYGRSYWRQKEDGTIAYVGDEERRAYDSGKTPPSDVHSKWEKLSKSKGNVIDPLEIISEYGTDAMRMALCLAGPQNPQIDLDRRRLDEQRSFANKIWNGARFIFMNLSDLTPELFGKGLNLDHLHLEDRWLLSLLNRTARLVNHRLENYAFDHAATAAYEFYWNDFCAYYLEIAKPILFGKSGSAIDRVNKQRLLLIALLWALRLLHPMAPFITEELFQKLKGQFSSTRPVATADPYTLEAHLALTSPACIVAPYPQLLCDEDMSAKIEGDFELMQKVIYTIRNIRGELQVPPGMGTDILFVGSAGDELLQLVQRYQHLLPALLKVGKIEFHSKEPARISGSTAIMGALKIVIPLPAELLSQEKARLQKQREKLKLQITSIKGRLENQDFVKRAPAELIAKNKADLQAAEKELLHLSKKEEEMEKG